VTAAPRDLSAAGEGDLSRRIPRRAILDISFAMVDYAGAMDVMDTMVAERRRGYVCAAAVHVLMVAQRDPKTRAALEGATLVVPDGMPIVWAANALGERLGDRVYGPELMRRYNARSARLGHRVWLFGGNDEHWLAQLERRIRIEHPSIRIVGGHPRPERPLGPDAEDALIERINRSNADVLWVGLGAPAQEKWMARTRARLDTPVMCGVGAAFDFLAGRTREAPLWMQRRGLEWIYRISQEPRRLLPRYLSTNPRYLWAVGAQLRREGRGPGGSMAAVGTSRSDSAR
jgi:N-acetylglucosaminyldiphosphoundecaprenol N-acetyl-beta-D-mannosaminyltransferase